VFLTVISLKYAVLVEARRQKIKWGVFFIKKSGNGGCFCKKVDLSTTHGALCTVSVFFILHLLYFYIYLYYGPVVS